MYLIGGLERVNHRLEALESGRPVRPNRLPAQIVACTSIAFGRDVPGALLALVLPTTVSQSVTVIDTGSDRDRERVTHHDEGGLDHLVLLRQVEPDLEELERIGSGGVEQREHLAVHEAATRRHPLQVSAAIASRAAQRVAVVDEARHCGGQSLEASVRMLADREGAVSTGQWTGREAQTHKEKVRQRETEDT